MNKLINFIFIFLLVISCFEEDEKVLPYPGNVTTITDDNTYFQSYFDFETNSVVKSHHVNEWDMAFGCHSGSWHVRVNSGNDMFVFRSALGSVYDTVQLTGNEEWHYDNPTGFPDSSAMGVWCDTTGFPFISENIVYVIAKKGVQGYQNHIYLQMISADSVSYQLIFRQESETSVHQVIIQKSDSVNFTYFSFEDRLQKNLEPDKSAYDIVFMPYYDLVYGIVAFPLPYLVRGVILNMNGVEASVLQNTDYNDIDNQHIVAADFLSVQNLIGWDWKDVNIDFSGGTATYSVRTDRIYLVKSVEGNFYKLRFLSYTLNGKYGYPRFEFQLVSE